MTMAYRIFVFLTAGILLGLIGCGPSETEQEIISNIQEIRQEKNQYFATDADSPLSPEEQETFAGLRYFPVDLDYRFQTTIREHDVKDTVSLTTSTDGVREYIRWGEFGFSVNGERDTLQVYTPMQYSEDYDPYFFIPFADQTNGSETYGGGRYLDLPVKDDSDTYVIDFNWTYNPYCAYDSDGWSCPLPPEENTLDLAIRAGEMAYQ